MTAPRSSRPGPGGPARQRPASPPGCRVARGPPRPAHGRRDRQRPRPLGRGGRQRAGHPGRPGRGRPRYRQAAALRGQLRDRRRSRRHHPQGPLAPPARSAADLAGRASRPPPAPRPRRAPAPAPQAAPGPVTRAAGRSTGPARWPTCRRRGAAHAARRGRAGAAVRAARHRQDQPGRGGVPRRDHRRRRRRHHDRRLRRRVHPAARRHLRVHVRAADPRDDRQAGCCSSTTPP